MSDIQAGRWTSDTGEEGVVVFLIGMRINRLAKPWKWIPPFVAMPRMLVELHRRREQGLLHAQTFLGGRTILVVQYWRRVEDLDRYARNADLAHLPAWRRFNQRTRGNDDVGVFHETYRVGPGGYETIYVNMPSFGLGAATGVVPVAARGQSARHRMDPTQPDDAAVAPPD